MMKYLITLFLLACWMDYGHADNRVMKCVGTDGHVTYARACSQGDTTSQIQMGVSINVIQGADDDSRITTNKSGKTNAVIADANTTSYTGDTATVTTDKNNSSTITAEAGNNKKNSTITKTETENLSAKSENPNDSLTKNNDSIANNTIQERNTDPNGVDDSSPTKISDSDGPVIRNSNMALGQQDATVVITGSQFGVREGQAAPILFDFTEIAYENGIKNEHHESFQDGRAILRIDEDPETLWYKPSNRPPPLFTTSRPQRHANSKAHYYLGGENSFLGWPSAYGGLEPPINNKKLYIAWWLKIKYDSRYYWSISREDATGTFKTNELVEVNGIRGLYIGRSNEGISNNMEQFIFSGQVNANEMEGHLISGQKSGATTRFPTTFAGATGTGYLSPGANKYLRLWNKANGQDLRVSWTQRQVWQKSINDSHFLPNISAGGWSLMELWLDLDRGNITARVNINGNEFKSYFDVNTVTSILSPTIALLGFNGKTQVFQITEVDDIYLDNRFSHIAISDKPEFSSLTSYELQHITSWEDNRIEFKLNLGSINPELQYYVYVITEEGNVNQNGFPLCSSC